MRLDIIGSVASGKTTLASELSSKYKVPYYQKDNIVWKRTDNGDMKRSDADRDKIYSDILSTNEWIVEGSPRNCLNESFECCDYIILLDIDTITRLKRVITRWTRQRIGKEPYNSAPTLKFLLWNIKWVLEFNRDKKSIINSLENYGDRFKIFKNSKQVIAFIESVYKR